MLEAVVLLHGIGRTHLSMRKMERFLSKAGYRIFNIHYPSRKHAIEDLVEWLKGYLREHHVAQFDKIHFVTHSMGGLVARAYLHKYPLHNMGRLVMLGPPNFGSELADKLQNQWWYKQFYGPAGQQLTTHYDLATLVGKPNYDVGIIAGTRTCVPFSKQLIFKKPNDGMVSVESTRIKQAKDCITMPVNHAFIMQNKAVMQQVLHFIHQGRFQFKVF